MNRATLIGHLGADPEVRHTQSGQVVVNMRIATSQKWRDKTTGEQKEATQWHTLVVWNEHLCKIAEQYLKKGSKILVEGMIATRKWQDKDGNDRYSTEIVLSGFNSQIIMLDRAERPAAEPSDYGVRPSGSSTAVKPAAGAARRDMDDEIPF